MNTLLPYFQLVHKKGNLQVLPKRQLFYRLIHTAAALLIFTILTCWVAPVQAAPAWIGISSSDLYSSDTHCGDNAGYEIEGALDGTGQWRHLTNETHYFIIDLGETYTIEKVQGRSLSNADPDAVNIYVSDNPASWGTAVASGITSWQDTNSWQEVDTTDKDGRYIKVEITSTERGDNYLGWGNGSLTIFDAYGEVANSVVFSALYEGSTQIAADGYTTTVDITDVTLSKSFLVFSATVNDNRPQCTQIRGQLYDAGSGDIKIDFERMESSGCPGQPKRRGHLQQLLCGHGGRQHRR